MDQSQGVNEVTSHSTTQSSHHLSSLPHTTNPPPIPPSSESPVLQLFKIDLELD